jgi:hypothetical protein
MYPIEQSVTAHVAPSHGTRSISLSGTRVASPVTTSAPSAPFGDQSSDLRIERAGAALASKLRGRLQIPATPGPSPAGDPTT